MKVIVCIKQVPDPDSSLVLDISTQSVNEGEATYVINPYDERAIEEALRIRERKGGKVTAISLGPQRVQEALRICLGMGVDEAIHLCDEAFANSDAYATAKALAEIVDLISYDVILCGERSIDDNQSQVGPMLAGLLDIPCVMGITEMDIPSDISAIVHRKLERGDREVVECPLPALFGVDITLNEPRYVSTRRIVAARKKGTKQYNLEALGLAEVEVGERGSLTEVLEWSLPRPRIAKGLFPPDGLSVAQRVAFVLSGGAGVGHADKLLRGPADEAGRRLVDFLESEGLIAPPPQEHRQT